jgi:hypothetical protein
MKAGLKGMPPPWTGLSVSFAGSWQKFSFTENLISFKRCPFVAFFLPLAMGE